MSFKCIICNFTRKDKYKVTHHMRQHLNDCDKKTAKIIQNEIDNLKKKKRNNDFLCNLCKKNFKTGKGLKLHQESKICSKEISPTSFQPKKIRNNIIEYGNNYSDLYKIVGVCRDKMAEIAMNQHVFEITDKNCKSESISSDVNNFYEEDLSHCSKYSDFFIEYFKGISKTQDCLQLLIRTYEIIYLNNTYKRNQNIIVDQPTFGGCMKLYIRNHFHYIDSVGFFEQVLPKHLADIIFVVCQDLVKLFYGKTEKDEYIFSNMIYMGVKTFLLSFLEKNDLMYKLSRHLYYLTYKFHHEEFPSISIDEFSTYDPNFKIDEPHEFREHPEEISQPLDLSELGNEGMT